MAKSAFNLLARSAVPLAAGVGLMIAASGDASAQACRNYAQTAVDQQAENIRLNCGFRGPRWQSEFLRHRNWCRTVNRATSQGETDARARQLEQCRVARAPAGGGGGRCANYAQTAVDQQAENIRLNCGLTGPRWQSEFRRHRNWCRNVNRARSQSETDARARQLEQCRVAQRPQRRGRCQVYADTAVEQFERNATLGCGFNNFRWNGNRRGHLQWCRNVNRAMADSETDRRAQMLRQCEFAQTRGRNCRNYADTAVQQNQENARLGCGFAGPRWTNRRGAHRRWCETAPRGVPRSETRARRAMLDQCRVALQRPSRCRPGERRIDGRCVAFEFSFPLPGGGVITIR